MERFHFVSILVYVILGVATVSGQAATLTVTVTDAQTGDPLNNASLRIKPEIGTVAKGVHAANGTRVYTDVGVGVYTLTASAPGYTETVMTHSVLTVDETKSIEIALSPEVLTLEKISVTASRRKEKVLEAPASVALVEGSEIKDRISTSVTEHLKSVRAVDVVTAGIGTSYVVVRGFNNVFSGSLLSLVDNRIASVPSLRVNSYTLIPTINEDIEQIEVVSGPGAAVYGPNSANGVIHIRTRSPFTAPGTSIGVGLGRHRLLYGSFRHADVINERIGYKVTTSATQGDDWRMGRAKEDVEGSKEPIFDAYRSTGEFRVDYRPNADMTTIFAIGYTQSTGIELTGIGAGQAKYWTYGYTQTQFIYKDLFAQVFWNFSDSMDTYLLRTGNPIFDKSDLYVGQIQHSYGIGDVQRFTYGADILLTRPDTGGTINGVNENTDNINEIGGYLQSETRILPKLKLFAAGRADTHNHLNAIVLSPRIALALQPNDDHNLRLTYNRAFNTPNTSNLFLDILSTENPFKAGIDIRAQGVPSDTGFTFKRSANGRPEFRSPFLSAGDNYIPLESPGFTNTVWKAARTTVMNATQPIFEAGLAAQGFSAERVAALSAGFDSAIPQQVTGVKNVLRSLDPETSGFIDVEDVNNIDPLVPTITHTYEVGYKGILLNRVALSADVYHSRINNFIGPLLVETPNVFLDAPTLRTSLSQQLQAAFADSQNDDLAEALLMFDTPDQGGNGDGSPIDELVTLFVAGPDTTGAAYIPFGTVTPEQAVDPNAVLLTYRNYGDISLNGLDLSFTYFLNPRWRIGAQYSFVSKDLFENVDGISDIALNAPKNKFGAQVQYINTALGVGVAVRARFVQGFPVRSGVYVGDIESYYTLDLNAGYDIPLGSKPRFSLTLQNLLDRKHVQFVGAPEIGRLAMVRTMYTF